MTPGTYRRQVKDAMVSALSMRDDVAGCWEGGSAATGRLDEFSDIDLELTRRLETA
jgi:predicted nucleotidyltransferase